MGVVKIGNSLGNESRVFFVASNWEIPQQSTLQHHATNSNTWQPLHLHGAALEKSTHK